GVVIDTEDGPVIIGKNVKVFPNATIIGPVFIGDNSWIKVGAQIYENTSIGPVCKVGGEVEETIIHSYSNKQHAGFLGHSYIAPWVNLGADTNNSDLKNNYGNVKVYVNGQQVDTGLQFVGLTMGDHSKAAINSMFNTGTVVGVCSNIFGFGFPPKYVPSFSWGAAGETFTTFSIDKAIEVARRVMARRKIELTATEEKLFRKIFELTSDDRKKRGMPV
ncbi:MAG: transferase, partial [Ignavibacteriales bacterium]|nr:transferase [Ignavibacteriales bacterium]